MVPIVGVNTGVVFVQASFWRQAQATVPILALRSADKLEGLEGIIALFDLRQVRGCNRPKLYGVLLCVVLCFLARVGFRVDLLIARLWLYPTPVPTVHRTEQDR